MKLYTLMLAILISAGSLYAQIVLGTERLAAQGDRITTWEMDTTGVSEGNTGANQDWNFSGLQSMDALVMDVVNASGTPYFSAFPGASLAGVISEGEVASYTFYSVSGNQLNTLGTASDGFATVYTNIETIASYPFSFGSSFSDSYEGATDLGEGMLSKTNGEITVSADAYGILTLPNGISANALRVKTARTSTDSLFVDEIFVGESASNTTTYNWYISNAKYPVFSVIYIHLEFLGNVIETKNVGFTPQSTTSAEDEEALQPAGFGLKQNFPNPFNPTTRISYSLQEKSFVTLKVYNVIGKEVAVLLNGEKEAGNYSIDFNGVELSAGVYFYTLSTKGFSETKKMILLK